MTTPQPVNRWDASAYAANAGFVPALGAPVLALLAPQPGERILDLGCGDGVLTEKLLASGATVSGVDFSPEMVAAAKARGLVATVMDGQALAFHAEFDAVFTNAALHWMMDHAAVAQGVFRALKPGGRFVG
ncbi:MAG: SAM-dependent methyltransferase, partial [Xanthomonas sp.]|nr:SAM-dependent methyltransferase [Xanthomonas sp.]